MKRFTAVLLVLLAAGALTIPWLSLKPFYSVGEPREAIVAQQMLATGDWVIPDRYDDSIPTKPPGLHWLIAIVSLIEGEVSEWSARLPSAFGSMLAAAALCLFLARRESVGVALLSSLLLVTSVDWHRASMTARVDMVHSSAVFLALLFLFRLERKESFLAACGAAISLSAAVLTKGPVGILLPAAAIAVFSLTKLRFDGVRRLLLPLLSAALLSGFWYFLAWLNAGNTFVEVLWSENFARFFGTMQPGVDPHEHSAPYFWAAAAVGFLPWSLCLLAVGFSKARAGLRCGSFPAAIQKLSNWRRSEDEFWQFSVLTVLLYILFFSFSSGKRPVYLLPIYPLAAYLACRFLIRCAEEHSDALGRRVGFFPIVSFLAASLVILLSFLFLLIEPLGVISGRSAESFAHWLHFIRELSEESYGSIPSLFLLIPLLFFRSRLMQAHRVPVLLTSLIAFFSIGSILLNGAVLPSAAKSLSEKRFASRLERRVPQDIPICTYRKRLYGTSFYLRKPLCDLKDHVNRLPRRAVVIMLERDLPLFLEQHRNELRLRFMLRSVKPILTPYNNFLVFEVQRRFLGQNRFSTEEI